MYSTRPHLDVSSLVHPTPYPSPIGFRFAVFQVVTSALQAEGIMGVIENFCDCVPGSHPLPSPSPDSPANPTLHFPPFSPLHHVFHFPVLQLPSAHSPPNFNMPVHPHKDKQAPCVRFPVSQLPSAHSPPNFNMPVHPHKDKQAPRSCLFDR